MTVNSSSIGGFDVAKESIATRTKLADVAAKCTTSVVAWPQVTVATVVQFCPSLGEPVTMRTRHVGTVVVSKGVVTDHVPAVSRELRVDLTRRIGQ